VQTVKVEDSAELDFFERREWEEPIAGKRPDLDAPKTGRRLPDAIRRGDLRPVFTTTVTRRAVEIEPQPATRIEAAIDVGEIRAIDGRAVEPISEIELELKSGNPAVLYDVSLQLLQAAEVRIETQSKAERGYRLGGGTTVMPQPVYARPVTLDPAMTVDDALQRFGRACLSHLLRNESVALAGEPEGIHQMRVAVRRLRSVLSTLKRMLPVEHRRRTAAELRWIAQALSPARNWDTLNVSLLPPVNDALPEREVLEPLVDAVERCRREAFDDAKQAILSKRYTESILRLLRWFAARGWREQPISECAARLLAPIVKISPNLIERCHRKARRRSKRFDAQTPPERHRLRIALKQLRYIIEFLESLFERRRLRTFVKTLKALQDDLGHTNDVRTAYDLVEQFRDITDRDTRAIDRAGGMVLGWHERDLVEREPKLRKRVRRFKELEPFW
jgi:inorganic triphosphatase YgiF